MLKTVRFSLKILCVAGVILSAGCSRHLERTDAITSYSGDSVASNNTVHTINPTPRRARYRHLHHDGTRMMNAIDKYHKPPPAPPSKAATAPKISTF